MLKTQSEYRTGNLFYYVKLILLVNQKLLFFSFHLHFDLFATAKLLHTCESQVTVAAFSL